MTIRFVLVLVATLGMLLVTLQTAGWLGWLMTLHNPDVVVYGSLTAFFASFLPWRW